MSTSHCPNCGTEVHYGFNACPGCRASLEYGAPVWTGPLWIARGVGIGVATESWGIAFAIALCGALATAHIMRRHIRAAHATVAPSRV